MNEIRDMIYGDEGGNTSQEEMTRNTDMLDNNYSERLYKIK